MRMLPFTALVAAVTVALSAAPAPSVASLRTPSACAVERAPRVLLMGDSNIAGALGRDLQERLELMGYQVRRQGKPSSGLARPDFYNWFRAARRALRRHRPDVVVFMFGGNDGKLLKPGVATRHTIAWHREHAWIETYRERVRAFAELLAGDDRTVVLLSPTNRRPRVNRSRMRRVRRVQAAAVEGMDQVRWIDMFPLSSDHRGRYLRRGRDHRNRPVRYRKPDGVHLTPDGARVVADRLLPLLLDGPLRNARCASRASALTPR